MTRRPSFREQCGGPFSRLDPPSIRHICRSFLAAGTTAGIVDFFLFQRRRSSDRLIGPADRLTFTTRSVPAQKFPRTHLLNAAAARQQLDPKLARERVSRVSFLRILLCLPFPLPLFRSADPTDRTLETAFPVHASKDPEFENGIHMYE